MGQRIRARRGVLGISQEQLGQAVGVSFQAVSGWERGTSVPDTGRLRAIARALQTSVAHLMGETDAPARTEGAQRLFDEERMYTFVKAAATAQGLEQTLRALPFAREKHRGQVRKGTGGIPYISHPLTMCCHALAMALHEDDLLAAVLLHDVVEDCGVTPEALPVDAAARETVRLLSKDPRHKQDEAAYDQAYYARIAAHPHAMLVKLLDRCHNLSVMCGAFSSGRALAYARHNRRWVLPLADRLSQAAPKYSNACFLLKYQMQSLLHTVHHLLADAPGEK